MGDTARPVEGRPDQEEQAGLIRRTGNGPTVDNETELLEAEYGPADMAGVFSGASAAAADVDDQDAEPVDGTPAKGWKDDSA
ncbi:hypothetical protein ACIQPP_05655 [Streptomyces violaceusniger]|uniref:hypothetical protein n=1 Tax=Streptomyces violaceusniger TaxID=68280 RepID=UPI000995E459|nr:hypothetical protein [Streptomyces hygroscopicus]AQW55306.1 hypothetical protein SHXM_08769 [Streptomyces hygroscopicus]